MQKTLEMVVIFDARSTVIASVSQWSFKEFVCLEYAIMLHLHYFLLKSSFTVISNFTFFATKGNQEMIETSLCLDWCL